MPSNVSTKSDEDHLREKPRRPVTSTLELGKRSANAITDVALRTALRNAQLARAAPLMRSRGFLVCVGRPA